jgi:Flp pilus assembly protein TadD
MMIDTPDGRRWRKLEAARGYLALDLPTRALCELAEIDGHETAEVERLRGDALRLSGDDAAALAAYDRAVSLEPADVDALRGMAACYKRTGRLPLALAVLLRAYRLSPHEPDILYHLACYAALSGERVQALSWLGRALRQEASLQSRIADEPDFAPLRGDPGFEFIVQAVAPPDELNEPCL